MLQAKLEGPHCYEEEANRAQSKRIILDTWKEVASIYKKQALDKQSNHKTDLDIWHTNLDCASKSSQAILQKAQSKILRLIIKAPWYVSKRPRSHIRKVRKTS